MRRARSDMTVGCKPTSLNSGPLPRKAAAAATSRQALARATRRALPCAHCPSRAVSSRSMIPESQTSGQQVALTSTVENFGDFVDSIRAEIISRLSRKSRLSRVARD